SRTSRSRPWASVWFALAVWIRPDAALPAVVTAIVVAVQRLRAGRFALRPALVAAAPFVLLTGVQEAWRLAYYHAWGPNTYYAKLDGALAPLQGLRFLDAWATEYAIVVWLPFAVLGAVAWRRREPDLLPVVLLPVAAFVAYVVAIGGDHFEFRMLDLAT